MELDALGVIEYAEQVSLDGVRIAGLTQDLQQCYNRSMKLPFNVCTHQLVVLTSQLV